MFSINNDDLFVLFGDEKTGGEGGLHHIDEQVVGEDIQFLHLLTLHVCVTRETEPVAEKN